MQLGQSHRSCCFRQQIISITWQARTSASGWLRRQWITWRKGVFTYMLSSAGVFVAVVIKVWIVYIQFQVQGFYQRFCWRNMILPNHFWERPRYKLTVTCSSTLYLKEHFVIFIELFHKNRVTGCKKVVVVVVVDDDNGDMWFLSHFDLNWALNDFELTFECLICCARYGGLSFGQENTLVRDSETQMIHLLERMASAVKIDHRQFKNVTNVSVEDVLDDVSHVYKRLITRKNVKVSHLEIIQIVICNLHYDNFSQHSII